MDQSLMLPMNKSVQYDPNHLSSALKHLYSHLPLPVGGCEWHTTWHSTRFTFTMAKDVINIDLMCLNQPDASRPFRNCVMLNCWVLVTTNKITWSLILYEMCFTFNKFLQTFSHNVNILYSNKLVCHIIVKSGVFVSLAGSPICHGIQLRVEN